MKNSLNKISAISHILFNARISPSPRSYLFMTLFGAITVYFIALMYFKNHLLIIGLLEMVFVSGFLFMNISYIFSASWFELIFDVLLTYDPVDRKEYSSLMKLIKSGNATLESIDDWVKHERAHGIHLLDQ